MTARRQMLDEALSIGRKELGFLVVGDVYEAEKLARDRERILDEAVNDLDRDHLEQLADQLVEMKSLHDKITGEARKLHSSIKTDLAAMKKQNRRIAGYSFGSGNMPRLARDRFVSKKS
ncbi:MAG: hypothetical protein KUA35_05000 [Pseudodesulfovibrio sp.]|uniref:Flagellar protein FliT n=1 Tax=Pseudodesulfovibrio aespoeensis (strain ATCC 700646 / DSM 10631 / Aspo-2) TaxID=643562 RepID=E6VRL3_PSEA9|nr:MULTISPECIES: hypothetical protein [Pseudodesulfovibrio]MBU4191862.1 hypothetical protein [Pseudomonadota bacterium]ADU63050.1 hypothetical protein Daes_2042 [Pseudodesulfovibrio aespoeensis Aspo-2]MBU4244551.1 hypothetical protein [Pseudomonadota bacterium]MBU4377907.1 hypothetical protein [Pseudomonadota bacterium]MBU4475845.1 hypothetical protein [Pseudomonadota bacterium]